MTISGISFFLYATAYHRNAPVPVDKNDFLRLTSSRMEDLIVFMSYFAAAASRSNESSLELGNSKGTGYNIEIRLSRITASSDTETTGSSSGAVPFGGWGRVNMSRKKGR